MVCRTENCHNTTPTSPWDRAVRKTHVSRHPQNPLTGIIAEIPTEPLYERNPYRDIRLGYGTLQMLELSDSVKKARSEVMSLMQEIERFLPNEQKRS